MQLSPDNLNFGVELLMNFPFAYDHDSETALYDFVAEHYEMPSREWSIEFSGARDAAGNEVEPWDGTVLEVAINAQVALFVEFHPCETVYFFNDTYLGNTGGHFHLSLLKWDEFLRIVELREQSTLLFFLLLPLVVGSRAEAAAIRQEIAKRLEVLPFRKEHRPTIAGYLYSHTTFDDDNDQLFAEDPALGTVCHRNHSERNPANEAGAIVEVNRLIKLAGER